MTARPSGTDYLKRLKTQVGPGGPLPVSEEVADEVSIEAWLKRHNVEYAPPMSIPMSAIDTRKSRDNQARKDPIVDASVERYTTALKRGDKFPPILGYQAGGKFVIIDGNNRHEAHKKAGKTEIKAILISASTPDETIQLLTIEANIRHGVTPDAQWLLRQALQLAETGFTDQAAADATGLNVAQLRGYRQQKESEQRAKSLKIAGFDDLPVSTKKALQGCKDDPVFFQAATTAIKTGMKHEEVLAMLKLVREEKSEGARIEAIGRVAKERGVEAAQRAAFGKSVRRSAPKHSLAAGMGMILAADPSSVARQLLTKWDKDQLYDRCVQAGNHLLEIMNAIEARTDLDEVEDSD